MTSISLHRTRRLSGCPQIPGDKSISHRALLLGALATGTTRVEGLLHSADVLSTWRCLESLGVEIQKSPGSTIAIQGRGLRGLKAPHEQLDCGNSGTTLRLLMGLLAAQPFESRLTGDSSLQKRPMNRVAAPLRQMGASFELRDGNFAPLTVHKHTTDALTPLSYDLPVASAQLKSALLLAGLFADGRSVLTGKIASRDHTERMLEHFGVRIERTPVQVAISGTDRLHAADITVPGDFSTAAFWLAAAALVPESQIEMKSISLNPTRLGFLKVLQRMGARIEIQIETETPEPKGSLRIRHSPLRGASISENEVPELIDELPVLSVLATQAEGRTEVRGARELRVKESDRIEVTGRALRAMGATVTLYDDGFAIEGPQKLTGAKIETESDHRIAMAFSIAALAADGTTEIDDADCVAVSYPRFYGTLRELCDG